MFRFPRPGGNAKGVPERTIGEILAGIATTERVSGFLAGYDERDAAIERLVNDVILQRLSLVGELQSRLVPDAHEEARVSATRAAAPRRFC